MPMGKFKLPTQVKIVQGLVNVPFWGLVSHHQNKYLYVSVGDYIENIWVMFNWDIYQALLQMECGYNQLNHPTDIWVFLTIEHLQ